jgi:hypothetical protein
MVLAPGYPGLQSSRTLARALTGDLAGARADLESVQAREGTSNRARRDEWIQALRRDENPFTPEVLESLRGH